MNQLASFSLDVIDHVINDQLEKLAEVVEPLSNEAKVAHVPTYEEQAEHDETDFAVILWHPKSGKLNKYALYTPELAEINMAFLANDMNSLPDEIVKIAAANLTKAATDYNLPIPNVLDEFKCNTFINNTLDTRTIDELAYLNKTSTTEEPSDYALPQDKKYPIHNETHIKKAAKYFDVHHYNMDLAPKLQFALNVVKAADKKDVDLSGTYVEKFSNLNTVKFSPDFKDHIQIRKSYLKGSDETFGQLYTELQSRSEDLGPSKTAQALFEIDKKAGVQKSYGQGITDPLLSTIDQVKLSQTNVDGVAISLDQIQKLPPEDLTVIVGNDVIPELKGTDGLEVLKSLPTPIRKEILALL